MNTINVAEGKAQESEAAGQRPYSGQAASAHQLSAGAAGHGWVLRLRAKGKLGTFEFLESHAGAEQVRLLQGTLADCDKPFRADFRHPCSVRLEAAGE